MASDNDFVEGVLESGLTPTNPFSDLVLTEVVARKVLLGSKLSAEDVQNSVVWDSGVRK